MGAQALLDQAESLGQEAAEELGACDRMEGREALLEHLEGVREEMRGKMCLYTSASYLIHRRGSASERCLLERLHDYDTPSSVVLTNMPMKLEPMACKSCFFDVALNYVSDYPAEELQQALEECSGKHDSVASTGFLGWFRR